jgi:hypothetical protein
MNRENNNRNNIWLIKDRIIIEYETSIVIPNGKLNAVPRIEVINKDSLNELPDGGGCYWIWTNEPVNHSLHKNRNPIGHNGGQIIYNGIAQDGLRGRILHHLFGVISAGWSGISMDILLGQSESHRKKAMSTILRAKVPFINNVPIRDKELLFQLYMSEEERNFVSNTNHQTYFFRNGININDEKHRNYSFIVYFIHGLKAISYIPFIEKKWREINGLPKLCSYSSGR